MPPPEQQWMNPREFKLGPFHWGKAYLKHAFLSNDPSTQLGLKKAAEFLKKGRLGFGNDHQNALGIGAAGAVALDNEEVTQIDIPIALSIYRKFGLGLVVRTLANTVDGIYLHPVARKKEFKKISKKVKRAQRKGLPIDEIRYKGYTREMMVQLNANYANAIADVEGHPNHLLLVDPWGGRDRYGEEFSLKSGVVKALQAGTPLLLSLSVPLPHKESKKLIRAHRIFIDDEILVFSKDTPEEEMRVLISERYRILEERAEMYSSK